MKQQVYVLYHYPCADGMAAALAAKLHFDEQPSMYEVHYIPCRHEDRPEIPAGSIVYFVDYSWPYEEMKQIADKSLQVVVLDHHKTAAENLAEFAEYIPAHQAPGDLPVVMVEFDNSRSGAVIAWDFFHPGDILPLMFRAIQDRDLWKFKHSFTKPFSAYLRSVPLTLEAFEDVMNKAEEREEWYGILDAGRAIESYESLTVEALCKNALPCAIGKKMVAIGVNSPVLQSEIGARLLELYPDEPFSAVWYERSDGKYNFSLRSRKGSDVDVSAIAKQFGGGGHFNAAGYVL